MRPLLLLNCLLAASAILGADELPEFRESPLTKDEVFPQRRWSGSEAEEKAWKEPFTAPLKKLLEQGLPDPLGLPYHKIEIPTGNCSFGDSGITSTEGWLLPAEEGKQRHAIAWNGLIYPLVAESGPADLEARAKAAREGKIEEPERYAAEEALDVSASGKNLIRTLYFVRLGHEAAARAILPEPVTPEQYLGTLSGDWLWYLYDRAVCAHMRGDPKLALASLDEMKRVYPSLEKWANASRKNPTESREGWTSEQEAFRTECKRRIDAGINGRFDEKAFVATKPDIAAIVGALDRIAIPQPGQPADVPLWESPLVIELSERGPEAVEPLLRCLESDARLTQSVHYWRRHHRSRTILGVYEAALYALQSLLHADFFQLASTGDSLSSRSEDYRKKLATTIRTNWEKYGRETGPKRAYRVLSDDNAGSDAWLDTVRALFHTVRYDDETGDPIPPQGPMPGEILRERKDPSVSDLLEKRLADVGKAADDGDRDAAYARLALLADLLDWDPARARTKIAEQSAKWLENGVWSAEPVEAFVRFMSEVSDKAPEILPVCEAVAWKRSPVDYPDWSYKSSFVTELTLRHGDSLKRPAAELWTHPDSPWCLKSLRVSTLENVVECWRDRELTHTRPFRELLESLLSDDTTCGTASLDPAKPGKWTAEVDFDKTTQEIPDDKKFALKPDIKLPIRRKDVAGRKLKKPKYAGEKPSEPLLEYHWSLEDRDKWLENVRKELKSAKQTGEDR